MTLQVPEVNLGTIPRAVLHYVRFTLEAALCIHPLLCCIENIVESYMTLCSCVIGHRRTVCLESYRGIYSSSNLLCCLQAGTHSYKDL